MKYQYVQTLRNSYELNLMMMCDESTEYRVQSTEYRVQITVCRVQPVEILCKAGAVSNCEPL